MNVIFETVFGSNLYGTNTEDSDLDYKGVYIPNIKEVLTGKTKIFKSINSSNKFNISEKSKCGIIETEYYTLQKFLKLAYEGQIVTIDMLFSPENYWCSDNNNFWYNEIYSKRSKFISKQLSKFVEYAIKQTAKYGIKGSRINTVNKYLNFFSKVDGDLRLCDLSLDHLIDNHSKCYFDKKRGEDFLQVCGKRFPINARVKYVVKPLKKYIENYGNRAVMAAKDYGVDKKAVSHAFRSAFEVAELVETGDLKFPLKNRQFLKLVKSGDISYKELEIMLESVIDQVDKLVKNSNIPDKPEIDIDEIVLKYYNL